MKKALRSFAVLTLLLSSFLAPSLLRTASVQAYDPLDAACTGAAASQSPNCASKGTKDNPLTGANGLLMKITRIIALFAGFAAIIVIIFSGIQYITSGGDAQKATKAKNTLVGALIGIVIIAMASTIIMFVLTRIK